MPLNPVLAALTRFTPSRTPIWLMRQAGRYLPEYRKVRSSVPDFLTLCYTPALAAEVTLQPLRRFDLDAAIVFSDILVIPHALGQAVRFETGEGPVLDAITGSSDLPPFDADAFARALAPVYETLGRVRSDMPASADLIGFAGAPWTLACYMVEGGGSRDFAAVKKLAYADGARFDALIGLLVEAVSSHLEAQIRAGAQLVQLFDSWAGVLPDWAFDRWVAGPARRIVERLGQSHPDVPVICFPRLAGAGYLGYAAAVAPAGLSLDTTVPLAWVAGAVSREVALQGNLDPVLLELGGAAMLSAADSVLKAMTGRPFIFNLGHGVQPGTPPSHVGALVDHVHAWRP